MQNYIKKIEISTYCPPFSPRTVDFTTSTTSDLTRTIKSITALNRTRHKHIPKITMHCDFDQIGGAIHILIIKNHNAL